MFIFLFCFSFCFVSIFFSGQYLNLTSQLASQRAFSYSGAALLNIVSIEELLGSRYSIVFGSCLIMFGEQVDCTLM